MAQREMRHRSRQCKHCGTAFEYEVGKGRDRAHCSPECRVSYQRSRRLPKSEWPVCSTPSCERHVRAPTSTKCNPCYTLEIKRRAGKCSVHKCDRPATRVGHGVCELHYQRIRHTGSTELTPRVELQISSGYRMVKAAGHPLAQASNEWAFEHRVVAHEKYGAGPHPCHWCGAVLEWAAIVVDHLNEDKADNSPTNLVVACSPCNRMRGAMIPFIQRMLPERIGEFIATFEHMRRAAVTKAVHDGLIQSEERRSG